jgi:hypothetical protein
VFVHYLVHLVARQMLPDSIGRHTRGEKTRHERQSQKNAVLPQVHQAQMLTGYLVFEQQIAGFEPAGEISCNPYLLPPTLQSTEQTKENNTATHGQGQSLALSSQSMISYRTATEGLFTCPPLQHLQNLP